MAASSLPILVFRRFSDPVVEAAWRSMETPGMSPFLHYDYLRYVAESPFPARPYIPKVACLEENDEIVMLVPLMRSMGLKSSYWKMLGDIQGCDRTDALWKPSLSFSEREKLCAIFYASLGKRFKMHRIQSDSPLLTQLPESRITRTNVEPYVTVPVPGDAETLFKGLHPAIRQNIRTAYNRLNRNGIEVRLEVFDPDNPMTDAVWKKIMDLYFDRLFSKYKINKISNPFAKARQRHFYYKVKHDTLSLRQLPNSFHAVLWHGERIIAFMNGLKTHDGATVSVPRLAIDSEYSFYSPGYVLINEVIKYIAAHPVLNELDLSRGDEKYKLDFGGRLYYTYDYDLR